MARGRRYAFATLLAAEHGGAEALVLCDTNGGTLPWEIEARVREDARGPPGRDRGSTRTTMPAVASPTRSRQSAPARRTSRARSTATASAAATRTSRRSCPTSRLKTSTALRLRGRRGHRRADGRMPLRGRDRQPRPERRAQPYVGRSARSHTRAGSTARAIRQGGARRYQHVDPSAVGNVGRLVGVGVQGRPGTNTEILGARQLGHEPGRGGPG